MSRKAQHPCPDDQWWVGTGCAEKPEKLRKGHTERKSARFMGTEKQWEKFIKDNEGFSGGSRSESPKPSKGTKKAAKSPVKKTTAKKAAKSPVKKTTAKKAAKSPVKKTTAKKAAKGRKKVDVEKSEVSEEVVKPTKAKPKAKGKAKAKAKGKAKAKSPSQKSETIAAVSAALLKANSAMSVVKLKELAASEGIKLKAGLKKAELIDFINEALSERLKETAEQAGANPGDVKELEEKIQEAKGVQEKEIAQVKQAVKKVAKSTRDFNEIEACKEIGIDEKDCKAASIRARYQTEFSAKSKGRSLKEVLENYRAQMLKECKDAGIDEDDCNYESLRGTAGDAAKKMSFRELVDKRKEFASQAKGGESASASSEETSSEVEPPVAKAKAPSKPRAKNWWDEDAAFDRECDTKETYYHATPAGYECTPRSHAPAEGEVAYKTKEGKVIIANRAIIDSLKKVFPGGEVLALNDADAERAYKGAVSGPKPSTPKPSTPKPSTPKQPKQQSPPKTTPENREAMRERIIAELRKCIEGKK